MKTFIKILSVIVLLFNKNIYSQSFQWAKRAGLYQFDLGYAIGSDNAGNVYIAGKFEQNAYFGGTYVNCEGNHDIYIAKYGPTGDFKWVRTAGGTGGDYAHSMAVDGAGNCYLTGEIEKTSHFGSTTLTSHGSNDVFIAKYDTNGNLIWAKNLGGSGGSDKGLAISLKGSNIYITGNFQGTGYFQGASITSSGGLDIFIAKCTTDGTFQWIKKAGGSGNDEGYAISNDNSDNVYVTGYFSGTASFSGTSIASTGHNEIFIAKYSPSGGLIWVKKAGGSGDDYGMGIKIDNSNNLFLTGGFRNYSHFGSIAISATSGGHADIFIARYTSSGDPVWIRKAGGSINDYGRAITIDANSNSFITGNFGLTAHFGSTTISGADSTEIYFASYDANGNFRWVLKAGGVQDVSDPDRFIEMGLSICTDPFGNVFGSGAYRSNSTFGSTTLNAWSKHTDIYLTKISSASTLMNDSATTDSTGVQKILHKATYCSGGSVVLKTDWDTAYSYSWKKNDQDIIGAANHTYKVDSPGLYTVTTKLGNRVLKTENIEVTELKGIAVSIAPSDPIFCQDSSVILKTNTGDEYIYQWRRNGEVIPGATSTTYKTNKSGDYQVKIIQGSCFDWSGITNVSIQNCVKTDSSKNVIQTNVVATTESKDDSLLVKIYPNPNSGLFTIEINMVHLSAPTERANIDLVNPVGQIVYHTSTSFEKGYSNKHIELDNSIPPGIYFLQITIGDKIEKTRMMLTR